MKKHLPPSSPTRPDVYQLVTDRLLAALEAGVIPWRKPWNHQYGLPRNYVSNRAYSGINAFLLHIANDGLPFFVTFRQARALGGYIRKGAKGLPVIYYHTLVKEDPETGEQQRLPFIKHYIVFNITDVEGVNLALPPASATMQHAPLTAGEAIVSGWANRPLLCLGARNASYSPLLDCVRLPLLKHFHSAEEYYATLFHELTHATGHPKRLHRPDLEEALRPNGQAGYAREELTAEMGAAFLCAHAGFDPARTTDNAAAYVQFWLDQLHGDKKLVVQAASRAQRATELILGILPSESALEAPCAPAAAA
ncbi:DUF1738 domain-containing protein [Hymenobacter sp. BT507]|uniref:DUF1738 domain-containing protein n=1 Tax=Hymenobacter citatus TaxID=2763506 RepID=A0ABR7MMV9_9BACT|nr:zincin-like metallopeptidase domain-containing protein [Hymenobacter citatus]MBC6612427.1 DUF1738 domain-containing protein [Hymenobacter citatus]